tara:strand:- start:402 stop:1058 length:657 start_codon:yes stop_codon:yes gene_type:complete
MIMSKVLVRHHILNGGEVWLQRRRTIPAMFCISSWYDWYKLDTELYRIDVQLNKLCAKVEKLLAERTVVERDLKSEKKDVDRCTGQTKGIGDPFLVDLNQLPKDLSSISKPEKLWSKVLNPRLYARASQKGTTDRQKHIQGQEGGRSVFLSEELGQFKDVVVESTGADTIVPYRHKDNGKGGKGKGRHGKNRIKGETDAEYQSRLEGLRNSKDEQLQW